MENDIESKIKHANDLLKFLDENNYDLTDEVIGYYRFHLQQKHMRQLESDIIKLECEIHYDNIDLVRMCMDKIRAGIKDASHDILDLENDIEEKNKLLCVMKVKVGIEKITQRYHNSYKC